MKFIPWIIIFVLATYIAATTFLPRIDALNEKTQASQSLVATWTPIVIERTVEVVVTATRAPTSLVVPIADAATQEPTPTPIPDTPAPTATPEIIVATVVREANLRTGPGTNYDIAGGVSTGTSLDIVGRNAMGDWYQLASGTWIFSQLVNNAPQSLPIVEAPPPPPPTPTPEPISTAEPTPIPQVSESSQAPSSGGLIGTIHVDSWRFEISEVRVDPGIDSGRQSIIFLGYLFNEGTQTDTFSALYSIVLQDSQGRLYEEERRVTWAAQDKYGADYKASINPEARKYVAIGYDVPASEKSFTLVPGSLVASWGQNVSVTIP
jgi:hypothetical protein